MPKSLIITGEKGFIGSHLCVQLRRDGHRVEALGADVTDAEAVVERLRAAPFRPDMVIHLAAISHPRDCEKDPDAASRVNVAGTEILVDALLGAGIKTRFLFASTAQVYEPKLNGQPIVETDRVSPVNLYAKTKYEAEIVLERKGAAGGLKVAILRLFNHSHRSQPEGVFLTSLYRRLQSLHDRGDLRGTVPVGNLDLYRDIGGLPDLLSAFRAVIGRSDAWRDLDIINVCGGQSRHLRGLAEILASRLGLHPAFEVDPSLVRINDPKVVQGSNRKLRDLTGWVPQIRTDEELIDSFLSPLPAEGV